jgi:uncharacterized protein
VRHLATLIVFAREPVPNRSKTRLIGSLSAKAAAAIASAFTLDALVKARQIGPARLVLAGSGSREATRSPYFRALARRFGAELIDQGKGSLGARMARVMTPYCRRGAVLIGVDTPSLPISLLRRGVGLLRRYPVVLGPSLDGGYYMVGVRGAMPDIFRGIRWGGSRVLADTIARLERLDVRYRLGPAWYDVDRPADLSLLAVHLAGILNSGRRRTQDPHPCPETARLLTRLGLLRSNERPHSARRELR